MRSKCRPLTLLIVLVCAINGLAQTQAHNDGPTTSTAAPATPVGATVNVATKDTPPSAIDRAAPVSSDTRAVAASDANKPAEVSKVTGEPSATADTVTSTKRTGHAALTATPARANPPAADPDKWQFQFSPYFWLASLHGTAGVGGRTTQVDENFSDIFDSLKFALMGVFEARKGRFVLLTDVEYVHVGDDRATPGPFFSNVDADFKTFIFDTEAGYRLYDDPDKGASVDVLGGIRVWHVSTALDFGAGILPATRVEGTRNWVDGVAGLRGKAALSEKFFVTGKFDLGGGGSNFTWQLFGGLGYNIKPKIALIGGYRLLDVNYNKDNFIYDMNQRGPIVGLGLRF